MAARPIRLDDPTITLGETPTPVDMTCFASGIHLVPEEDDAAATFCDPLGFKWVLTLDLKQSVGAESLDTALTSLGIGVVVPFEFAFTKDIASATNPHWTGEVRIPAWTIVDAGINEVTEVTLEMDVIGDITKDEGGVVTVLAPSGHTHEVEPVAA
jgi:hypothetical protein